MIATNILCEKVSTKWLRGLRLVLNQFGSKQCLVPPFIVFFRNRREASRMFQRILEYTLFSYNKT